MHIRKSNPVSSTKNYRPVPDCTVLSTYIGILTKWYKTRKKRNAVLNKTLKIRDKTCQVLLTGIVESINNKPSQVRPSGIAGFNIHEVANNKWEWTSGRDAPGYLFVCNTFDYCFTQNGRSMFFWVILKHFYYSYLSRRLIFIWLPKLSI